MTWIPHAGPQTDFLSSTEDEVLFGGSAFGGKSSALLAAGLIPMQVPTGVSLILRRTFPELSELIERAKQMFAGHAEWVGSEKVFRFNGGGLYYFGYGSTLDEVQQYIGKEYGFIGYDEVGLLQDERAWDLLMTRLRVKDGRLKPIARATANPGGPGQAWLKRRFIAPTKYGKVVYTDPEGLTRRFIPSRATDNPTGLRENPGYLARLRSLPAVQRAQLLDGDWDATSGSYLSELTRDTHIIPAFTIPDSWTRWGAFDWGYAHPAVFGQFAMDHEGNAYLVDSVHMHRKTDEQQAQRILEQVGKDRRYLDEVHAGHDCWDKIRARGSTVPSTHETFWEHEIRLTKASISRVPGWRNLRNYVSTTNGFDQPKSPRFYLLATKSNEMTFETLQSLVSDERDPEDVLKVDADGEKGVGGDDAADMVRYGLAARTFVPESPLVIDSSIADGRDTTPRHVVYGVEDSPDGSSIAGFSAGF